MSVHLALPPFASSSARKRLLVLSEVRNFEFVTRPLNEAVEANLTTMQFVRCDEVIFTEKQNNPMRDATILDRNRENKVIDYAKLGKAN